MTIKEFVDRIMLEVGDVKGEKLKTAEYFLIATEALKTVEAVYSPLFDVISQTPPTNVSEITISHDTSNKKKYFKVGRVSVGGSERYLADYDYVKLNSNTFLPTYGYYITGSDVKIAFSPAVQAGLEIKVFLNYVHDTAYFANENSEIELPENYALIALNLAKQYLYTKYGAVFQSSIPIVEGREEEK